MPKTKIKLLNNADNRRVRRSSDCELADIGSSEEMDCDSDEADSPEYKDDNEILDSSEATDQRFHYYPQFRLRHVFHQPKHPLSNYADSYDRFPTVA